MIQNVVNERVQLLKSLNKSFIAKLVQNIKVNTSIHQSVKILALCTSYEALFKKQLLEIDKCNHNFLILNF